MALALVDEFRKNLKSIQLAKPVGTVARTDGGSILVAGLSRYARVGDRVSVARDGDSPLMGEVIQLQQDLITVLPDGPMTGMTIAAKVRMCPALTISPCDDWLGRVIDPNGAALDGKPMERGLYRRPLVAAPPPASKRRALGARLTTGSYVLNTFLPIVQGQRVGCFAGAGVGKTNLLGLLVKNMACDVAVIALVGERSRELNHFTHTVLGDDGMAKAIVVAATSERSALERRRCVYAAMAIAEHFRDKGKSVLFVADSLTRMAEAHREIASAAGELPVMRGFPPSTATMLSGLCERAGPGMGDSGDITAVLSVLVQGSDMDEPVSDILRGVLDGHIVLDREIAERGRYPAINLLKSVSRSLPEAATEDENKLLQRARQLLSHYEQNALMIRSGLYSQGSDAELDAAVRIWGELDEFAGKCGPADPEHCFAKLQLILRRAGVQG